MRTSFAGGSPLVTLADLNFLLHTTLRLVNASNRGVVDGANFVHDRKVIKFVETLPVSTSTAASAKRAHVRDPFSVITVVGAHIGATVISVFAFDRGRVGLEIAVSGADFGFEFRVLLFGETSIVAT